MATHPGMLLAYDADGNVIATLDFLVVLDPLTRDAVGLADFAGMEEAAVPFRGPGEHVNVWTIEGAAGSAVWPQYLGTAAHDFRVELDEQKRIQAIVHRPSGTRQTRAALEAAIADRVAGAGHGEPADLSDLVGGPDRPLEVTPTGAVRRRPDQPESSTLVVRTGRPPST